MTERELTPAPTRDLHLNRCLPGREEVLDRVGARPNPGSVADFGRWENQSWCHEGWRCWGSSGVR